MVTVTPRDFLFSYAVRVTEMVCDSDQHIGRAEGIRRDKKRIVRFRNPLFPKGSERVVFVVVFYLVVKSLDFWRKTPNRQSDHAAAKNTGNRSSAQ